MHAMPQVPSGMQLHLPRMSYARFPTSSAPQYAYILATRTRGMHIQLLLAVGEFLICVAQCALPCLIIKNIVVNAGLPTAYGINQTHQNRVCSFARSNCRLLVCVPWFRATRGTKLLARTPDGIPPWNAIHRQGTAFRSLFAIAQPALLWFVIRPMLAVNGASALMLEDGMPLLAYGIGTVCCVVVFAISCCVAPCTFGTFQRMPRGGYAIDPMQRRY